MAQRAHLAQDGVGHFLTHRGEGHIESDRLSERRRGRELLGRLPQLVQRLVQGLVHLLHLLLLVRTDARSRPRRTDLLAVASLVSGQRSTGDILVRGVVALLLLLLLPLVLLLLLLLRLLVDLVTRALREVDEQPLLGHHELRRRGPQGRDRRHLVRREQRDALMRQRLWRRPHSARRQPSSHFKLANRELADSFQCSVVGVVAVRGSFELRVLARDHSGGAGPYL